MIRDGLTSDQPDHSSKAARVPRQGETAPSIDAII